MLLDDHRLNREALAQALRARGHAVATFASAGSALEALRHEKYAVMLCGVRPPSLGGLDVVDEAYRLDRDLPVILTHSLIPRHLQGNGHESTGLPVRFGALIDAVEATIGTGAELNPSASPAEGNLSQSVPRELARLRETHRAMRETTVMIAETLINAMEAKDEYLRGHSQRVAELAATIADEMGFDADEVEAVRLAGRLHDVGKIGIREEVLNKPGTLTKEEFDHVKEHVRIGVDILAPLEHLGISLDYVRHHHEHWDGGGYPNGLSGNEISLGGRILTAADAFDALTSRRAYRDPLTPDETVAHLALARGQLLDFEVFEALKSVVRRGQVLTYLDEPDTI
jgi:putative nucleotidyltransferase with HDIG domain